MRKIKILLFLFGIYSCTLYAQNEVIVHDKTTNKNQVFSLPEGMILNYDSLLSEWNAKKYLLTDSNCQMSDIKPYWDTDVYRSRLRRIPGVMEMPYNEIVQIFIDQYTGRLRHSVSYMLGALNFYNPIFEEVLDMYQLPLELKYLPIIESALDPLARSKAGAVGLWQFMLKTSKKYGLETNSLVDERCDPVKSTYAAAQYLRDLYNIYGDWTLVIAAYNCGPNALNKAIHRSGGSRDYWEIYPYLPKETRGYVPAFIAANYIMNFYCEHNICPMKTTMPLSTDTIVINRALYLDQISAICHISTDDIRGLNPEYKTNLIPGHISSCVLRLPQDVLMKFIDAGDSVYNYKLDSLSTRRAEVLVKNTVNSEVKKEKVTSRVRRNTRSRVRTRSESATVRKGDTLSDIANRNHTTVSKIKKLNRMSGSLIKPGQKLRVK